MKPKYCGLVVKAKTTSLGINPQIILSIRKHQEESLKKKKEKGKTKKSLFFVKALPTGIENLIQQNTEVCVWP